MGTVTSSFAKLYQYIESRKQVDKNQDEKIEFPNVRHYTTENVFATIRTCQNREHGARNFS